MQETVFVRDVMTRTYVGVSPGDSIAGACELMIDEGVNSAVVLHGTDPVALLDARDVLGLVADGGDPSSTIVGDVARDSVATIEPDRPLSDAVGRMAGQEGRSVVVVEGGDVVGVIDDHDVVAAHTALPGESAEPDGAMATPTIGLEELETDAPEYADQGVCEICGSLTRTLETVNGQTVCADCREL